MQINIPISLILFRFLLAPLVVLLTYFMGENAKLMILVFMYLGLISDILDGIIARKQNISSEKLRRMDSQVDIIFWFAVAISTWILRPNLIAEHQSSIWMLLGLEFSCYAISFIKFGKETCTHALSAKFWGISLLIAFTSLIGFNHAGIPFYGAVILGIISYIDIILIILILPQWTYDIPSAYHAYLIRKGVKFKRNRYFHSS